MKKRGNRRPWLLLLAVVGVCTLTLHAYSWYRWDRVRRLTILYGSDLRGELDPCSCVEGQLGGLARRATYIAQVREEGNPTVLLDAGGVFFREGSIPDFLRAQLAAKADSIVDAYAEMGYDAVNVGDADFGLGIERLWTLRERAPFPLLSANLRQPDGGCAFTSSLIKKVGRLRVGIFGLCQGETFGGDLVVDDSIATAKEVVAKLRPEVDILICLTHQGFSRDLELADAVKGIDIIIGGRSGNSFPTPRLEGGTIIVQTGRKGTTLGRLDVVLYDDQRPWQDATDTEKHRRLAAEYDRVVAEHRAILYSTEDPAEKYSAQRMVEKYTREADIARARMKDYLGVNHFHNQVVPLGHNYADHAAVLKFIDNYKGRVRRLASPAATGSADTPRAYLGSESCRKCHEAAYESWKQTRHAHAYGSLEDGNQEFDLECIGCHTTGYRKEGGFDSPAAVGDLRGVQCEVCHGPGAGHPGDRGKLPLLVSKDVCLECHTKEFNPDFEFYRFWARISHDKVEDTTGKAAAR